MTTIIGIAGRDPETLEDYVLLCGDSLGTLSGKPVSNNQKKIFADEKSNYALGVAGKCLSNYFSQKINPELAQFLDNPKEEERSTIEQRLEDINKNMLKEQGKNEFIVSLKEQKPILYSFNGKELEHAGSYCAIGSGIHYLFELKSIEKYIEDGRVNLAKKETINFIFEIMQKVASDDEGDAGTGGHMDFAIVTSLRIVYVSNYAQLEKRTQLGKGTNGQKSKFSSNNLINNDNLYESRIHPYQREQD